MEESVQYPVLATAVPVRLDSLGQTVKSRLVRQIHVKMVEHAQLTDPPTHALALLDIPEMIAKSRLVHRSHVKTEALLQSTALDMTVHVRWVTPGQTAKSPHVCQNPVSTMVNAT